MINGTTETIKYTAIISKYTTVETFQPLKKNTTKGGKQWTTRESKKRAPKGKSL